MVQNNIITNQYVYIHKETTNSSFMEMHYYLKRTGRRNNKLNSIKNLNNVIKIQILCEYDLIELIIV